MSGETTSLEFESDVVQTSIPSRSQYSVSDKQKAYNLGETIRFHIPPFQSFIDPRMTTLNFKVQVSNVDALVRFSNKAGLHSIIDNLRIYDANTNTLLENIQNYGELAEKLHLYTENRSIRNKRALLEGLEYTSRNWDSLLYDNIPARNTDNSQLFNHQYKTGAGTYAVQAIPTSDPNTIEVCLHLYSGIIGAMNDKMFPAILCNGLRVEIDTNTSKKVLELWTAEGMVEDDGSTFGGGDGRSCRFGITEATPTTANPLTQIKLYCEKNPGYNQNPMATNTPSQDAIDGGMQLVKNQLVGAVNFVVGKNVWGFNNASPPVWKNLGVIVSVECEADVNNGGLIAVVVNLDGSGANGDEYQGGAGNDNGGTPQDAENNTCGVLASQFTGKTPKVVLSDLQFLVKTCQPPQSYINSMLKQVATEQGVQYDFLSFDVYRNQAQGGENLITLNIPTINHRATSILTLPLNNSQSELITNNNFDTIIDDADNYNYIIDNKLQPVRRVPLKALSDAIPKTEQLALFEAEKSLSSVRMHPKNLDYQEKNFFLGRALARYGGVYDLASTNNVSLRIQYGTPTQNKLFINYIGGLRRLVVNKNGRFVET